jgi:hypothetical protein
MADAVAVRGGVALGVPDLREQAVHVAILSNFGSEVQRNCTRSSRTASKQRRLGSKNQTVRRGL